MGWYGGGCIHARRCGCMVRPPPHNKANNQVIVLVFSSQFSMFPFLVILSFACHSQYVYKTHILSISSLLSTCFFLVFMYAYFPNHRHLNDKYRIYPKSQYHSTPLYSTSLHLTLHTTVKFNQPMHLITPCISSLVSPELHITKHSSSIIPPRKSVYT